MSQVKGLWSGPTSAAAAKVVTWLEENIFGPYTHGPLAGELAAVVLSEVEHDLHEALSDASR